MESRKMALMNIFTGQGERHRQGEQTWDRAEEGEGGTNRKSSPETYITTHQGKASKNLLCDAGA